MLCWSDGASASASPSSAVGSAAPAAGGGVGVSLQSTSLAVQAAASVLGDGRRYHPVNRILMMGVLIGRLVSIEITS